MLAFQPHRYTRTRDLFDDFAKVLNTVDTLVLTDVYAAGEDPLPEDSRALARNVRAYGKVEPLYCADVNEMPAMLLDTVLRDGDVLLNMGAGSINKVPAALVRLAAEAV